MTTLPTTDQLSKLPHNLIVMYAVKAAELVAHLTEAPEAKEALKLAKLYLEGKATAEECGVAAYAAYAVNATYAATYAAYAAADAANATYAARAAAYATYAANAAYAATYAVANAAADAVANAAASVKLELIDYYNYLVELPSLVNRATVGE